MMVRNEQRRYEESMDSNGEECPLEIYPTTFLSGRLDYSYLMRT